MRLIMSIPLALALGLAAMESGRAAPEAPTFHYWHIWTDSRGVTHQTRCALHDYTLKSISPPAAPQWLDALPGEGASIVSSVMPIGWTGPWHEDPRPQWLITVSGRWFVETTDGKRVEMGPGDVAFGEDQGSKPDAHGQKGHLSGTVGGEPALQMIVQLKEAPTVDSPCHFH